LIGCRREDVEGLAQWLLRKAFLFRYKIVTAKRPHQRQSWRPMAKQLLQSILRMKKSLD